MGKLIQDEEELFHEATETLRPIFNPELQKVLGNWMRRLGQVIEIECEYLY
jgi:hypothetical protein